MVLQHQEYMLKTSTTGTPAVCLPPLEIKKESDETEDMSLPPPPPSNEQFYMNNGKSKGTFATQSYTLKMTKRHRQYGFKLTVLVFLQSTTNRSMVSYTVMTVTKHLTIQPGWYIIDINTENQGLIVPVKLLSHSQVNYRCIQLSIAIMPHIIVFIL